MPNSEPDVLLLFPPQTEARLFPYLSLPYLTGFLRRAGRTVHQADLNVELFHELLTPGPLRQAHQRHLRRADTDMREWYRAAMADTARRFLPELRGQVLAKSGAGALGADRAVRLANQAVEVVLEDSFLTRLWPSLSTLDEQVRHTAALPAEALDAPTAALRRLVERTLAGRRPRVIGLSVAFFSQIAPALLIAAWARALAPEAHLWLGGQQVMLRQDDLLGLASVDACVDALCVTAGEEPLTRALDALDGALPPGDIPGIRRPGAGAHTAPRPVRTTFRDAAPPDFADLPIRSYVAEDFQLAIVSCVGCYWGRCVFCSYGNRSLPQGAYQQGTPAQIADAVEHTVRTHGVDFVAVVDENTNLRLVTQAMREVRRRGVRVTFSTRNRLESVLLDPEFCRELASLGCVLMSVGYETNAQRLLDRMDKGVRAADYQTIIDNVVGAGINLRLSVMGGLFDETAAEAEESRRFLHSNEDKIGIDVLQLMVAEPGTLLAGDAEGYGVALDRTGPLAANPELNYLGGRHGYPLTVPAGPAREESLRRLLDTFEGVRPQGNDALPPHLRRRGPRGEPVWRARLRPWVRPVPPGPAAALTGPDSGSLLLADLVWQQVFSLPHADVALTSDDDAGAGAARGESRAEEGAVLSALTEAGSARLRRLTAADVAVAVPSHDLVPGSRR
ncbi:radical SAM protein [Streptomyces sp. NBC_00083]|uniref:B12-binding domain-containing radical SAM protein n=1 Tax=Streptomyces sp. NBC_00083 TaxID=2975647 RepID=UPI00225B5CCD|nr:radical SAM protein [Streptomyces sp. NBC_00083]MCX5383746.1 radical SAM protein [Streptomyces sp. NBC_00083]